LHRSYGSDRAREWYSRHESSFWEERGWASGFREWARGEGEPEWGFEIDAGFVFDGLGTAASAFGIAAARRNGRFDYAYALSAELAAVQWALPDGSLICRARSPTPSMRPIWVEPDFFNS
jgi:hypothetical protein